MKGQYRKEEERKNFVSVRVIFYHSYTMLYSELDSIRYVEYNAGKSLAKNNGIDPGPFKGDAADPKYTSVENYLLLGVDDDGSGRSRTDTMMVLSWDKSAGKMRVISFMRDIYADIPGYKSYKLNTAYYLGITYKLRKIR